MEIAVLNHWSSSKNGRVICEKNNKCMQPKMETRSENYYRIKVVLVILIQYCESINDHSQTVTYNSEYEQRTNHIYALILWDLEILGRHNWESTYSASFNWEGLFNSPYKVWLVPWRWWILSYGHIEIIIFIYRN